MIEKIYEIEGINDQSVDGEGDYSGMDPSFVSADMPSFLKNDGAKIHTI
jgi:hypothetical protein